MRSANNTPPSFGILAIAIAPQHQRMGVGKMMLQEVERIAQVRNSKVLHLSVDIANKMAIELYEHNGWKKVQHSNQGWSGSMSKILRDSI